MALSEFRWFDSAQPGVLIVEIRICPRARASCRDSIQKGRCKLRPSTTPARISIGPLHDDDRPCCFRIVIGV
jgi:hypothetical protein